MDSENVLTENAGAARKNDITLTVIHSQPKKQGTTLRPAEWLQQLQMQSKYIFYLQNGITSFEITLPRGVAETSTTTSKGTSAISLPVQGPIRCPDQYHTSYICPQQIWNLWCFPQPACISSMATLIQNNFNNFQAKQRNM